MYARIVGSRHIKPTNVLFCYFVLPTEGPKAPLDLRAAVLTVEVQYFLIFTFPNFLAELLPAGCNLDGDAVCECGLAGATRRRQDRYLTTNEISAVQPFAVGNIRK